MAARGCGVAREHDRNAARPPFVLRSRGIVEKFRYDWSNPLDRWIDAHYAATSSVGNLEILAWRGDGAP